ncbi:hypothetical protein QYF61_003041, partial [Mycteria americana]
MKHQFLVHQDELCPNAFIKNDITVVKPVRRNSLKSDCHTALHQGSIYVNLNPVETTRESQAQLTQ